MSRSILVVDDDESYGKSLARELIQNKYKVTLASNGAEALAELAKQQFDAVLTDLSMPGINGLDVVKHTRQQRGAPLVVVMTAFGTIELAVQAMLLGANDFLVKPFPADRVIKIIERSMGSDTSLPAVDNEWRQKYAPEIITQDPAFLRTLQIIQRIADVDCNVLLLGESGTGKELMARVVHRASGRRQGPFVPLNCAAIPESLVESELFGHVKGAFTGAAVSKTGRIAAANKGTLFLDEIGEMNLAVQAKVLRSIQDKEITPVGDNNSIKIDTRFVAATNRDLKKGVADKTFREDLYFRLAVIPIHLPPLRERRNDIPLLVEVFVHRLAESTARRVTGVSKEAMGMLANYSWPGNVRELENTIERLFLLKGEGEIGVNDLHDFEQRPAQPSETPARIDIPDEGLDLKDALEEYESHLIQAALRKTEGNQTRAADLLKINRTTLVEKLRRQKNPRP